MRIKQFISRIVMALIITFGVQTTASAQFGSLKGLANKAKKAVQDKAKETVSDAKKDATTTVQKQAESTVIETTGVGDENSASGSASTSTSDLTQSLNNFDVNYGIAKETQWTYSSPTQDILADAAYWCQQLRTSLKNGSERQLDYEALSRLTVGVPSFTFLDKQYHQSADARSLEAVWNWAQEKDQLVKTAWKLVTQGLPQRPDYAGLVKGLLGRAEKADKASARAYYFDRAFETTSLAVKFGKVSAGSGDESAIASRLQALYVGLEGEMKANYPSAFKVADFDAFDAKRIAGASTDSEQPKMRRGALLTAYKKAAEENKYGTMPASKGVATESSMKSYVQKNYPEWGTVVKVADPQDYNVHRDKLGNITYRSHAVYVLCQSEGYKVLHSISLHEDYKGGKYSNAVQRNDTWNQPIKLVK